MEKTKMILIISLLLLTGCSFRTESSNLKNPFNVPNNSVNNEKKTQLPLNSSQYLLKDDDKVIWKGESNSYKFVWSSQDLVYQSENIKESLFKWVAQLGIEANCESQNTPEKPCGCLKPNSGLCSDKREFKLLSVVGTLISFEDKYVGISGSMRDGFDRRYTTVDVSEDKSPLYKLHENGMSMMVSQDKPKFVISLVDLFDETEVLNEFLKNKDISIALREKGLTIDEIRTTTDLVNRINENDPILFDEYSYTIPKDFLTRFAIYDIKGGKVYVKLALPHTRNGDLQKQITLELSIPTKLNSFLNQANQRTEGFLMKDSDKISAGQTTKVEYQF